MKKYVTNIILGIWVMFLAAFSGFPPLWNDVILVITGLVISIISFVIYSREADRINKPISGQSFVDNKEVRKIQL